MQPSVAVAREKLLTSPRVPTSTEQQRGSTPTRTGKRHTRKGAILTAASSSVSTGSEPTSEEDGDDSDDGWDPRDSVAYIGNMLKDARALARANEGNGTYVSFEELKNVKVGDGVRICDGVERFWTRVYHVDDDLVMAQIGSHLTTGRWQVGQSVCFLKKHIYNIELSQEAC